MTPVSPLSGRLERPIAQVSAEDVERFGYPRAADAIEEALRGGVDPAADPARSTTPLGGGSSLIFMPSVAPDAAGVKLVTINPANPRAGVPYIHGVYVLFDASTLAPRAVLDGAALTTLRTPAMSIVGVRRALRRFTGPLNVVVFGAGPQGVGHLDALLQVAARDGDFPAPRHATFVTRGDPTGRIPDRPGVEIAAAPAGSPAMEEALARADVVVCATTSPMPLFDSALLAERAVTIAVGNHRADAAEVDPLLCGRAEVVVEDVATALRECGEIVQALRAGIVEVDQLTPVADIVRGRAGAHGEGRFLFKGSGMAWQDLAVASAIMRSRQIGQAETNDRRAER